MVRRDALASRLSINLVKFLGHRGTSWVLSLELRFPILKEPLIGLLTF